VSLVADFLLFLFNEKKLSPSTINGYRTAINSVWNVGGRTLTGSFHVDQLLKSFKLERPRSVVTVPKWDLNLVLRTLTKPPYHPVVPGLDPMFMSSKTVFLLLLASARRRGDIHAIDPNRITFTRTGVILEPSPRYLPKVLSTAEGEARYLPIVIKSLGLLTDDPDELALCPVLALKAYDRYARLRVPHRQRFFISTRRDANPVVKATLSSWVVKLLRRAYENATDEDAALASTSTHEIRALAASLAVQATYSLTDVLSAATWSTPSTFASHYLRDVSGVRGRLHVTGPCIVAGKTFR
jgi:integrase